MKKITGDIKNIGFSDDREHIIVEFNNSDAVHIYSIKFVGEYNFRCTTPQGELCQQFDFVKLTGLLETQ